MVHRTMGLPHKSEPKNSYCVIWDKYNCLKERLNKQTEKTPPSEQVTPPPQDNRGVMNRVVISKPKWR